MTAIRLETIVSPLRSRDAVLFALYGCLLAMCFLRWAPEYFWSASVSERIMPYRAAELETARASYASGLPLLVAEAQPAPANDALVPSPSLPNQSFRAVGVSDDFGMYLLVALLRQEDLGASLQFVVTSAVASLLVVYPVLFFGAFASRAVAALAPLVVVPGLAFAWRPEYFDVYWVQPWIIALAVPVLFFVQRRPRTRAHWPLLYAIVVAAALSSLIRSHAGLGVVLAACVATLWGNSGKKRLVHAVALLAVYFATVSSISAVVSGTRAQALAARGVIENRSVSHAFWHTTYIGLGWFDPRKAEGIPFVGAIASSSTAQILINPCGIAYLDQSGLQSARAVDEDVEFLSAGYDRILRRLYFQCIAEHPWHFFLSSVAKLFATFFVALLSIAMSSETLLLMAGVGMLLVLLSLRFSIGPREVVRDALPILAPIAPMAVVGLLPSMLAQPVPNYSLGLSTSLFFALVALAVSQCRRIRKRSAVVGGVASR